MHTTHPTSCAHSLPQLSKHHSNTRTASTSMGSLAKVSPLKRKQAASASASLKPRALFPLGNPEWLCPDYAGCPQGLLKLVQEKKGGEFVEFVTCDHNVWQDPSTCKGTLSMLKPSKDHLHHCSLCLQDVGGKPSLGCQTGEMDSRGYAGKKLEKLCLTARLYCCCT